jgi:hypothetical protein
MRVMTPTEALALVAAKRCEFPADSVMAQLFNFVEETARKDLPPYRPKEAAEKADVDIKSMYAAIETGTVTAVRFGKIYLIPRVPFDALLREGKLGTGKAA